MNIPVRFRPEIGQAHVIARDYPEGFSLADMVRDMGDLLPPEIRSHGVAQVGPDPHNIVRPENWARVRPFKGTTVNFAPVPGDDAALQSVARIGVIGAQLFSNLIPGVGPLISAAIGIGGSFLLAELAPKPKTGAGSKQLNQAGFANNALEPYQQIPRVVGRKRVAAPHLAPPIVEIIGEDADAKFCIGLAGRHEVSDLKINGASPVGQTVIRTGLPSDGPLTIYDKVWWQEAGSRLMEYNLRQSVSSDQRIVFVDQVDPFSRIPTWTRFRLGKIMPDRLVIDLLWESGIAQSTSEGKAGAAFEIFFLQQSTGAFVELPEVHFLAKYRGPLRCKIVIEFAPDPGGLSAPGSNTSWRIAFANTAAQQSFGAAAHSYYGTGDVANHCGVVDNILTIYVDPAAIPLDTSFDLFIRKGMGYLGSRMNYANNTYSFNGGGGVNGTWWGARNDGGTWKCLEDQALMYSTCTIEYFTRIWDAEPFDPEGLTTIEGSVRNQQIDSISFVAAGYVRWKWDRALQQWTNEPHVSENPAEIAYDIPRNDDPVLNSRPLSPSLIDDAKHGEWAQECQDNDRRCNAVIEQGSVEDALALCYQAGHARLMRSRKWSPWVEKDRSSQTPAKVFGPRDFWNWTVEKSFERKPHALRCVFDNARQNWITEPERIVYAAGRDASNATLFEEARYPSIDTDYNVDARARLDLAIMRKRAARYSFETRGRWMAFPRGTLIGVNHPMLHHAHAQAGIRRVIYDDPALKTSVMGLELDGEVDMLAGVTGVRISTLEAEVIAAQSSDSGAVRRIMFTAPIANDIGIDEGATVAVGPVGFEAGRFYVDDIRPGPRLSAKMILVDEAPEIHGKIRDMYQVEDVYALDDVYSVV